MGVMPDPAVIESTIDSDGPNMRLTGAAKTKLTWSLLIANITLFACYMAAGSVLLPVQVNALDPGKKEANLAVVTSISSFFTLFCQPIVGALSDRTRNKLGRRAPWMLGGAFLGGLMLMLLPVIGRNVGFLALAWVIAQVSLNALQGPMSAIVSDRFDFGSRGTASAFLGVGSTLGMTLGIYVAGLLVAKVAMGYTIFAALVMVVTLAVVLLNQDKSSADMAVAPFSWGAFVKGFWISPKQYPDFAWAFAQRFMMFLGYMGIFSYMMFILLSYLHLPVAEAGVFMGIQSLAGMVASVLFTFAAGWLSDKTGRRKIFVMAATLLVAVGCIFPLLMPNKTGILLLAIFAGAGFGAYMAVDVALVVDVLPHPEDAAKDLGVVNIANNVPQFLAPIINAALISMTGSYAVLFWWSIVMVVLASLFVLPIKKVR